MVTWNRANVVAAAAVLLLFSPAAGRQAAAVGPIEAYNPKDDPNYTPQAAEKASVRWERVLALVGEFERMQTAAANPRPIVPQTAPPQPELYGGGRTQVVPSQSPSGVPEYGTAYGWPYYGYGPWFSTSWNGSPRIPWWSLVPLRKHRDHAADRVVLHTRRSAWK